MESVRRKDGDPSRLTIRFDCIELTGRNMAPIVCKIGHTFAGSMGGNIHLGYPGEDQSSRIKNSMADTLANDPFKGKQVDNLYVMTHDRGDVKVTRGSEFILTLQEALVVKAGYSADGNE